MRQRQTINDNEQVNGFYINEVAFGFYGEKGEGREMLKLMGLSTEKIPFSIAILLQNHKVRWKDNQGNVVYMSFKLKPEQIECAGSYMGKRKVLRVFREWSDYEDPEIVAKLESEAIGDLCMRCVYEKMIE